MYCHICGNEIHDNAVICIHCGCSVKGENLENDEVNVGFCVLAVFFPLFGIIFWAIKHKETPKNAKAVGLCALITIIVCVLLYVVLIVFILQSISVYDNYAAVSLLKLKIRG